MCGIAGIFAGTKTGHPTRGQLQNMAARMARRGPDDEGVWQSVPDGIGFAHRRLSIIDLSSDGHQPMHSASGRYTIVLNGEIYNYRQLRKEIGDHRGAWRGQSDTEVLLNAVEVWGLNTVLDRVNGMFAFAIWDHREKQLTLVRDPMGKKPLYYGFNSGLFFFASELKAIKAHPEFRPSIDSNMLTFLLRHSYIPAPHCIYKGMHKLMPGTALTLTRENVQDRFLPRPRPYWDIARVAARGISTPLQGSDRDMEKAVSHALERAVSSRMIADVPLGAFLSGGIDSSLIAALMQKNSSLPVRTFTVGFESTAYDEAGAAAKVADHLGCDHTQITVTPGQALEVIPELPDLYDEPFADSSQVPTHLVSRLTRNHVTVALSGDGGDELFAGYNRHFWGRYLHERLSRSPLLLRRAMAGMIRSLSPGQWNRIFSRLGPVMPSGFRQTMPGDKLAKLAQIMASKSREEFYFSLTSWWQNPEAVVRDGKEPAAYLNDFNAWPEIDDFTHLMQLLDMQTYLPDDILTKVDRASMGASLEARAPFLDRNLVALSWQIPLEKKISRNEGKKILKQILYRYVPRKLVDRPKAGFGIPLDTWLRKELKAWACDLLSENRLRQEGFFKTALVQKMLKDHLAGKANNQYHLWNILMFQAWLEREKRPG